MYRQMITNAPSPLQCFGARYLLGSGDHRKRSPTPVHTVRGPNNLDNGATAYGEDMGDFYSAGLDPVFFCNHAMWNIWKQLGGKRRDLSNKDWLNSEFFFYDENRNPYRVRVRDCLDNKKMGYDYEPMPTPWLNFKPTRKSSQVEKVMDSNSIKLASKVFPLAKLDRAISFTVNRPANTQQEKIEKDEMLIFKGIKHDNIKCIRFDVFVNAKETVNADELDMIEFAGSYVSMAPLVHAHKMDSDEQFQVAITELLEENGLEDDDTIAVTLVPK